MQARAWGVAAVAAGVWAVTAVGVAHVAHEGRAVPSRAQLCRQYEGFTQALVPSRPPGVLRLAASRLAALAGRYPTRPLPDSVPVSRAGPAIRQVLALPYSTDQDPVSYTHLTLPTN
jgi:hypothetical protein